jgi:hypothetical protein
MLLFLHHNVGQNHKIKTGSKFPKDVAKLKKLGMTVMKLKLHSRRNQ